MKTNIDDVIGMAWSDKISFEVNKNNIVFEGLTVSNDVLLYGGSEIEVADLYNQMEEALVTVKNKLRQQEAVLYEQQRVVTKQAEQIHEHYELMEEKNKLMHRFDAFIVE